MLLNIKIAFQLQADHPQMCVYSYADATLTLTPSPWYSNRHIHSEDVLADQNEFSRSKLLKVTARARQTDSQMHRRTRPNTLPRRIHGC